MLPIQDMGPLLTIGVAMVIIGVVVIITATVVVAMAKGTVTIIVMGIALVLFAVFIFNFWRTSLNCIRYILQSQLYWSHHFLIHQSLTLVLSQMYVLMHHSPSQVVCQLCFSLGQTAPYCPCKFPTLAHANSPAGQNALISIESGEANESLWYPDSPASFHISPLEDNLCTKLPYTRSYSVVVGNGTHVPICHVGKLCLPTSASTLHLNNVLHIPKLKHNLLSIQPLCK